MEVTGRVEMVHTFGWYLRKYLADTRARGATPIICSLVPRDEWTDGTIVRDARAAWARDVARASNAAFLDLNDIIARRYEALGPEAVRAFFPADHTHTNEAGARFSAGAVVGGLEDARSPLAMYLRAAPEKSCRGLVVMPGLERRGVLGDTWLAIASNWGSPSYPRAGCRDLHHTQARRRGASRREVDRDLSAHTTWLQNTLAAQAVGFVALATSIPGAPPNGGKTVIALEDVDFR